MTKGERIKFLREKKGLSQVDLANKIDVSKQSMYKYENDIITNIPSDKIELLAKNLDTTPSYIMGWSEKNSNIGKEMDELFRHYDFVAGGTMFNAFKDILNSLNTISELYETALLVCNNVNVILPDDMDTELKNAFLCVNKAFSTKESRDFIHNALKKNSYEIVENIIKTLQSTVDSLWNFIDAVDKSNNNTNNADKNNDKQA